MYSNTTPRILKANLKHISYHIIVTVWPIIKELRSYSMENQTENLVSNMKNLASNLKKNGLHK
jgi:hypothetical protein